MKSFLITWNMEWRLQKHFYNSLIVNEADERYPAPTSKRKWFRVVIESFRKKMVLEPNHKWVEMVLNLVLSFYADAEVIPDILTAGLVATKSCLQPTELWRLARWKK